MIFDEEILKQQAQAKRLSHNKHQDAPAIMKKLTKTSFRREMSNRLGNIKTCGVPDFDLPNQVNLFDEMMHSNFQVDEHGLQQIPVKRNLWAIFYDAINIFPKFEKLKKMIDLSNVEKNSIEQQLAREALEKYLLQKRYEEQMRTDLLEKKKKKVKVSEKSAEASLVDGKEEGGVDVKDEVENLMKDQEKLASIQKMLDQKNQTQSLASNNQKIKQLNSIVDAIFDMHSQGQIRHEALKRSIHYKYPEQKMQEKLDQAKKLKSQDPSFLNQIRLIELAEKAKPRIDNKWDINPLDEKSQQINFIKRNRLSQAGSRDSSIYSANKQLSFYLDSTTHYDGVGTIKTAQTANQSPINNNMISKMFNNANKNHNFVFAENPKQLSSSVRNSRNIVQTKTQTDYSREFDTEVIDLCDHMVAHILLYINNFIVKLEEAKPKKNKKLHATRIEVLKLINENLQTRTYEIIDIELIPRFFRDDEHSKELLTDLYPILKLIVRYNSRKIQQDQSLKSVISQRLSNISRNLNKVGSFCSSPMPQFKGEIQTPFIKVDENEHEEKEDEVKFNENFEQQPRKMLTNKQNSKSVDLLDFGHTEGSLGSVPEEITKKSFVKVNNNGVQWFQPEQKRMSMNRSFLKSQQNSRKVKNLITSAYCQNPYEFQNTFFTQTTKATSYKAGILEVSTPILYKIQQRKKMSQSFVKPNTAERINDFRNKAEVSRRNIQVFSNGGQSTAATHDRRISSINKISRQIIANSQGPFKVKKRPNSKLIKDPLIMAEKVYSK